MRYRYNGNTEEYPKIGDEVTICRTNSDMNGVTGVIGGWVDYARQAAIVILTKPYRYDGDTESVAAVPMPVVCLTKQQSSELYSNPAPESYFDSIRAARDNMSPVGDNLYDA